ncbi:hypothetical protein LTR85_003472 [Meristemomyces frigidus]|nr:hypothetical protein LTR85_003472 [Meristemomyces frigidus]
MIFDPSAGDPVRDTSAAGGVYRTTVGPVYYESWSNFPHGTKFVSTLNFQNDSLEIALDMAVASVKYQEALVEYFKLGNEPTNYASTRWDNSTAAYVAQWKNWTAQIDAARALVGFLCYDRYTGLNVKPADIIPAGVDSADQVAEYSIHSYPLSTCDLTRAALATIPNILNHTGFAQYADEEILPSAQAALDSGSRWVIGEFNSISCSGNPNVSDTFAQALWVIDSELIYAVNSAGSNGTPGYSTYDMLYPTTSSKRGDARILPSFAGQLFLAEAFATNGTRTRALDAPEGVDGDYFAAYAFYDGDALSKLAVLNLKPYYANATSDCTVSLDLSTHGYGRYRQQAVLVFFNEEDVYGL